MRNTIPTHLHRPGPGDPTFGGYDRCVPRDEDRHDALTACREGAAACERCPELVASRTQVVFGSGAADADLMFVGEAPGREQDASGEPLVGRSAALLDELLASIGMRRDEVFVTTALKCRPPDNRDAAPSELSRCRSHLERQIEIVRPRVVCTLGSAATRLLRGDTASITTVHGRAEIVLIGTRAVRLYPLFHPDAALYQRSSVALLHADVARLPSLLALPVPEQPAVQPAALPSSAQPRPREPEQAPTPVDQLGLF